MRGTAAGRRGSDMRLLTKTNRIMAWNADGRHRFFDMGLRARTTGPGRRGLLILVACLGQPARLAPLFPTITVSGLVLTQLPHAAFSSPAFCLPHHLYLFPPPPPPFPTCTAFRVLDLDAALCGDAGSAAGWRLFLCGTGRCSGRRDPAKTRKTRRDGHMAFRVTCPACRLARSPVCIIRWQTVAHVSAFLNGRL